VTPPASPRNLQFAVRPQVGVRALAVLGTLALGTILGGASGEAVTDDSLTRYWIDLDLDPAQRNMDVVVRIEMPGFEAGEGPLEFMIHSDLDLRAVEGPHVAGVRTTEGFDPGGLPESYLTLVEVIPAEGFEGQAPFLMEWRYSGWIGSDRVQLGPDALHSDWVELDIGSVWVPVRATLAERFRYEASVRVPPGYEVIGAGSPGREGDLWTFRTEQPHLTATLAVAPSMTTTVVDGEVRIAIHNPGGAPEVEALARAAADAVGLFAERFGPLPSTRDFQLVLPPDRRARPEGYSRDGYVMMVHGMEAGEERLRVATHEIAHFWWHHAPSQGPSNFFNESFAEYSAWLALEAALGEEAFERRLAAAREASRDVGSIRDWTPATNHHLVYDRGPVLLHELRERVGDDRFFELVRETRERRVESVEAFAALIQESVDQPTARWLTDAF
jgi:hypothetical protein